MLNAILVMFGFGRRTKGAVEAKAHIGAFKFKPRWKEELVVIGEGGRFVLELPMGVLTA